MAEEIQFPLLACVQCGYSWHPIRRHFGFLSLSLVLRPLALFEIKGKISVDTAPGRFIIILIR